MRNYDEDEDTDDSEWEISIDMDQLSLVDSHKESSSESTRLVKSVDYALLRGKLLKASAALFRARFVCPECGNSREVCPGCGGFSQRFSDLFAGCGWPMSCPVCIGYGVAYDAKCIQDNEEELDALWKEINGMLAKDTENLGHREKGVDAKDSQD
ncbi:hypothetical protein DFH09DRAFT_642744 [Mycena vulgaris]|nr:hypothetical protein DFH09DRAFT_642744 [Mycena vulgaris]